MRKTFIKTCTLLSVFFVVSCNFTLPPNVYEKLNTNSGQPGTPGDNTSPGLTVTYPTNGQEVGEFYTLQGTVSDSESGVKTVYVKLDNGSYYSVPILLGNWSANFSLSIYGLHTNFAYAVDNANNSSAVAAVWVVRGSVPSVIISSPANGSSTNISSITVSGISSIDAPNTILKVQVQINGGAWTDASGTINWTMDVFLSEGANTLKVRAIGDNNKTNESAAVSITFAPSIPSVSITSLADGSSTNISSITVSGISSIDAPNTISKVQVQLNGGAWTDASGTINWIMDVFLSEGANTLKARAIGDNNKTNESAAISVTYINPIPSVSITSPANGSSTTNFNITVSGTASIDTPYSVTKVQVQLNGGAWIDAAGTTIWSKAATLIKGANTLKARAIGNNNKTNESTTISITNKYPDMLVAYDGEASDALGYSVAVSADGNTIVAGAYFDDDKGGASGSVYCFKWNGSMWLTNKFVPHDGLAWDQFGWSVAVSADGNIIAAGAFGDDDKGTDSGSVYRLYWNGSMWLTNKFVAFDGAGWDNFGISVAISADGSTIAAGANYDDDKGTDSGSIYRFYWNGSMWLTNKFVAFDGAGWDYFGVSVAVSADGSTIAAGANYDDDKGGASGSVYRFYWNGSAWATNKIVAYNGAASDEFGYSLSISADGNTIAAGAYLDDDKGADSGSVYRYKW